MKSSLQIGEEGLYISFSRRLRNLEVSGGRGREGRKERRNVLIVYYLALLLKV